MAKQKGWVNVRGSGGRWPVQRMSVKDALVCIADGGKMWGTEILDKNGYAIGYLTKAQRAKIECSNVK